MSFELTFVGTLGGPLEHGNCLILVKPAHVTYQQTLASATPLLVMIDAGLGMLLLADVIADSAAAQRRRLAMYLDLLPPHQYLLATPTDPFAGLAGRPLQLLQQVLARVDSVLLSHAHLDHIQGLVLNLPQYAGRLTVHGLPSTVDALSRHVFNGIVWPDLVLLGLLHTAQHEPGQPFSVAAGAYTVTLHDLYHGHVTNNGVQTGRYTTLAFLVADNATGAKLLAFGDFEADAVLRLDRNARVWQATHPYIQDRLLKAIVLECSTALAADTELHGHMNPVHLAQELCKLQDLAGSLRSVHVIINHVKETFDDRDPRRQILLQLRALFAEYAIDAPLSVPLGGASVVV